MSIIVPTLEMNQNVVQQRFDDLKAALPAPEASADVWEEFLWRWNDIKIAIMGEFSRRYYREAQDTNNPESEAALRFMREHIRPMMERYNGEFRGAVLACAARPELEQRICPQLFVRLELSQAAFAPANVDLQVKEGEIVSRYERRLGKAEIRLGDEVLTLPKASARLKDPDEHVRRTAWEAVAGWLLENREDFHHDYDELIGLRDQMGRNLGMANFVPVAYRKMGRTDYGPEQAAAFREGMRQYVVPTFAKLRVAQAKMLGASTVKPWNIDYYPGFSLPTDVVPVANQLDQAQALFDSLHPRLAHHFKMMRTGGLIDLESRPGKRPGAFAISYDDENKVAIFCNSTGGDNDVMTLTHEMGHAFQAWESQVIKPFELRWPTLDAAELYSMGMEFLSLKAITTFFSPEDALRYRRMKLIDTLSLLPYIAVVDAFQHWVYENPGHTHAQREARWGALWDEFVPGIDFTGFEAQKMTRWMRQSHIFSTPFYYIDYAIAETGALQLWLLCESDHEKAMASYLELCRLGGTKSLLGIFESAGLRSPFESDVFAPLMAAMERELGL